jgi:hypothetical protein
MGKIKVLIHFFSGTTEAHTVDSIFGYDYHGDYFVVHEIVDGITHDYPYCLRDIKSIEKWTAETVH